MTFVTSWRFLAGREPRADPYRLPRSALDQSGTHLRLYALDDFHGTVHDLSRSAPAARANTVVVDTGDDGVADTTAAGDDTQVITVGLTPTNSACVIAGANGIADTSAVSGDDNQVLALGTAAPIGVAASSRHGGPHSRRVTRKKTR